jgi:hypothetical protein
MKLATERQALNEIVSGGYLDGMPEEKARIMEFLSRFGPPADRLEAAEDKLRLIADWCAAYPLEMWPKPNMKKVRALLGDTLLTQLSAYNMRHVCEGIAKIAAQAGGNDARINKELDAGDSWAWIRAKFERSGDKYRWYKPRTDELVGTRYEVMGWLHCLFADTDPTVFIDITLEHQKRTDEAEAENDALKAQVKRLEAPVSDEELQPLHDKYGYFKYGDAQGDVSRKFVNDLLSARTAAPTTGAGGRQRCG